MSSTLYELPSTEEAARIAEDRKADAVAHWEKLKTNVNLKAISSLEIGFHAHYLKKNGLLGMLGFEDEGDAIKASGCGHSTWYDTIRLAEAFEGISEEQFISMKLGNAKALANLPESKRRSREWIRMAGVDEVEVFERKVDVEMEGKARPSDGKEKGVTLKLPMPLSRKDVVLPGLEEYAKKVGIENGDIGRAVEMLLVEKKDETSLIQAITNAVQRIKQAHNLRTSYLSAEEALERVMVLLDEMALEFADALKVVKAEEEG
jgi:hypothetical protein